MLRTTMGFGLLLLLLTLPVGCDSETLAPSTGNLTLLLTDAPLDLSAVSAVNVTLTEIVLFGDRADDDAGVSVKMRQVIPGDGLTVNLLDLQNGRTTVIADAGVPAGDYRKLRLRVSAADLVLDDDEDPATPESVRPVFIPSNKVDIPVRFSVAGGERVQVLLDFDAQLSVQVNETHGQHPYILRPVIVPVGVGAD